MNQNKKKHSLWTKCTAYLSKFNHSPYASHFLGFISFIESSFFPISPDFFLIPMSLNKPQKAYYYALICTIFSTLGGVFGYYLGIYAYDLFVKSMIEFYHQQDNILVLKHYYDKYGILALLLGGFSPFPYKIISISAGIFKISLITFIMTSVISRGLRFFLSAFLINYYSHLTKEDMIKKLKKVIYIVSILIIISAVVFYLLKSIL